MNSPRAALRHPLLAGAALPPLAHAATHHLAAPYDLPAWSLPLTVLGLSLGALLPPRLAHPLPWLALVALALATPHALWLLPLAALLATHTTATARRTGPTPALAATLAGAALSLTLLQLTRSLQLPLPPSLTATLAALAGLSCPPRPDPTDTDRATPAPAAALAALPIGLRLAWTVALAAAWLEANRHPSLPALSATLTGLATGAVLVGTLHTARGRVAPWAAELLGWLGLVACTTLALPAHTPARWIPTAFVLAALAGVSLSRPTRRGRRPALAALACGLALGAWTTPLLHRWSARDLDDGAVVAQVLRATPEDVQAFLDQGQLRLRFADPGPAFTTAPLARVTTHPTSVRVLDVGPARLLLASGRLRGVRPLPTGSQQSTLHRVPAYLVALASLGPEPPAHLQVLGLGAGGVLPLAELAATDHVRVREPLPGVLAAHLDPGNLFGTQALLQTDRVRVRCGPRWDAQEAWSPDPVIVTLPGPDEATLAECSGRRTTAWLPALDATGETLRAHAAAFLAAFPADAHAFWPEGAEGVVFLGGAGRLSGPELVARWEADPVLADAFRRAGLASPLALLASCVAGPQGLAAFVKTPGEDADLERLALAGAETLAEAYDLSDDPFHAARGLAKLAESVQRRDLPGALPLARAAVARDRGVTPLRVLGDLLATRGRTAEAAELWQEARDLDPHAVAPAVSLAAHLHNQGQVARAQEVLASATTGDPAHDAPLDYVRGQFAWLDQDYATAAEAFELAGDFRNARERAQQARQIVGSVADALDGPEVAQPLSLEQRLDAAELLWVRGEEDLEQRVSAVEVWLELAQAPERLGASDQRRLARWLGEVAAREPRVFARENLYRQQARVLREQRDTPRGLARWAEARVRGGEAEETARALEAGVESRAEWAESPAVWRALAHASAATGSLNRAAEALRISLAVGTRSSADAPVYVELSGLYRALERWEDAERVLNDVVELAPEYPGGWVALGDVLAERGREGEAARAYRGFLERASPVDPERERVESWLSARAGTN